MTMTSSEMTTTTTITTKKTRTPTTTNKTELVVVVAASAAASSEAQQQQQPYQTNGICETCPWELSSLTAATAAATAAASATAAATASAAVEAYPWNQTTTTSTKRIVRSRSNKNNNHNNHNHNNNSSFSILSFSSWSCFAFRMTFLTCALAFSVLSCFVSTLYNCNNNNSSSSIPLPTLSSWGTMNNKDYCKNYHDENNNNDKNHMITSLMMINNNNSLSNTQELSALTKTTNTTTIMEATAPNSSPLPSSSSNYSVPSSSPHMPINRRRAIFYNIYIGPDIALTQRIVKQQLFQIVASLQRITKSMSATATATTTTESNSNNHSSPLVLVELKYIIIVGQEQDSGNNEQEQDASNNNDTMRTHEVMVQIGKEFHAFVQTACQQQWQKQVLQKHDNNTAAAFQWQCELLQSYHGPGHDEQLTLTALHEYCVDAVATSTNATTSTTATSPTIVTYLHSKGSFHASSYNNRWRRHLTWAALHPDCVQAVVVQQVNAPTTTTYPHEQKYCHVCGLQFYTTWGHFFAGNMWTADCSYVSRLLTPAEYGKQMDVVWNHVTTHRKKVLQQQHEQQEGTLEPIWTRLAFQTGMDDPLSISCTGRYAAECWVGSHPDLNPCDVSPTASLRPWRMETLAATDPYWNKKGQKVQYALTKAVSFQFQTYPRFASWYETIMEGSGTYNWGIPHLKRLILHQRFFPKSPLAGQDGIDPTDEEAKEYRLREYFLLPGLLLRFRHLYGQIPNEHSWMYKYYPDGFDIRNEVLALEQQPQPQTQKQIQHGGNRSRAMDTTRPLLHDTLPRHELSV